MHRDYFRRPVFGSGLDMLEWDEPIRNGMGQVGTGLGHVKTKEICYKFRAQIGPAKNTRPTSATSGAWVKLL